MEDFLGQALSRTSLRVHFMHFHLRYTIVVMEKGERPHPLCLRWEMFIPWEDLNGRHPATEMFSKKAKQKRRRWVEEKAHTSVVEIF